MIVYAFNCPKCGEYIVDKRTYRCFVAPELQADVDRLVKVGNLYKVIVQHSPKGCHRCAPKEEYELEVVLETIESRSEPVRAYS